MIDPHSHIGLTAYSDLVRILKDQQVANLRGTGAID